MRTIALTFVVGILTISGSAQTSLVEATTTTDSSGQVALSVKNLRASVLTAYAYVARVHPGDGAGQIRPETIEEHGLRDPALNGFDNPILPNQTGTFHISGWNGQVTLTAALWADGTSYGDPVWVHKLLQRRALARKHIDLAIAIVQDAMRSKSSVLNTSSIAGLGAAQVQQEADDFDEIPGVQMFYQSIQHLLGSERPKHSTGEALTDAEMMKLTLQVLGGYRDRVRLYS